ncbi:MAG: hypothetical protein IKV13_06920 [Akkermansia sp.]|nr:hypothetical protein [Akkermansia sp.]
MMRFFLPIISTALLLAACSEPQDPMPVCEVYQVIPNGPAVLVQLHEELARHDNGEYVTLTYRATVRESVGSTLSRGTSLLVDTFELNYKDWMIISTDARYISREADGTVRLNATTDFNFTSPSQVRSYPFPLPGAWETIRRILKEQS